MSDGALAGIDLSAESGTGAWLELAVAADHEAVEAVSEILSRAAPGGTSVEPAFELVNEGLAARVDVARPAMVRAHRLTPSRRPIWPASSPRPSRNIGQNGASTPATRK